MCSVACSEYFPFVIQSLCQADNEWQAVIISTLLLAVFAELIPQWLVPQRAICWGFYCRPLIWGCMWLTSPVSYPLAWALDHLTKRSPATEAFSNAQLEGIIKYHKASKKNGGQLSQDAARIILGALGNEGRTIAGGDTNSKLSRTVLEETDKDVEKSDRPVAQSPIVKWDRVKTVDINEPVDDSFIQRVKGWPHTRIPVIGKSHESEICKNGRMQTSEWGETRVFGFLHVKGGQIGYTVFSFG